VALRRVVVLSLVFSGCAGGGGGGGTATTTVGTSVSASEGSASTGSGEGSSAGTSAGPGGPTGDPGGDPTGTSGDPTMTTSGPTGDPGTTTTGASTSAGTTTGGDPGLDPDAPPVVDGNWYRPGTKTTWQYQLTGDLNLDYDATVWGIDLFDHDEATIAAIQGQGRKVICYFSAGSGEDWRPDYDQIDPAALGEPLDGWPGERWLDFRHPSVLSVMRGRLDLAVSKGCDGVDPDNVDTFTQNSGFQLSESDQIAYNRWMANRAHERGLAVGLKNDLDQVDALVEYYDFQVNEQCHEYNECDVLQPFVDAGKPVFNVEYPGSEGDANAYAPELCPQALAADLRTVMSPLELDGTWRVACD